MLTIKQHQLLMFIHGRLKDRGIPPSFVEMQDHLELKSKSGIHRMLGGLQDRGFIRRLPYRARAVEVLRLPESTIPPVDGPVALVAVPVMGRIGTPLASIQVKIRTLMVAPDTLKGGRHLALDVRGDSMAGAGINDGDVVIIREETNIGQSGIALAVIDEDEAMLSRVRRKGAWVSLEPANPAYEARMVDYSRVRFIGRLAGLVRVYPDWTRSQSKVESA